MHSSVQLFICFYSSLKMRIFRQPSKKSEDLIIYNHYLAIVKKNDKAFPFSGMEELLVCCDLSKH